MNPKADFIIVGTHFETTGREFEMRRVGLGREFYRDTSSAEEYFKKFARTPINEVHFVNSQSGMGMKPFRKRLMEFAKAYCGKLPTVRLASSCPS